LRPFGQLQDDGAAGRIPDCAPSAFVSVSDHER
jgi:hypothetical protein